MILKRWADLPPNMQTPEVREYYDFLSKKKFSLVLKRIFDIVVSSVMLVVLSPAFLIIAICIKCDSKGPVFYRQERVTQYGKCFRIFKFRTMVQDADKIGTHVTVKGDNRITKLGKAIRKYRIDELCQLIDILRGTMTFVGTRPEAVKYLEAYTPEMWATLLLPAGVTSEASIRYRDEDRLLRASDDIDKTYIEQVLPSKMKYNLEAIKKFGFWTDIGIMIRTVFAVILK